MEPTPLTVLVDEHDLATLRRLFHAQQRARTAKSRLRARRSYDRHLADLGYRGAVWEPHPDTGKYEMTSLIR